MIEPHMRYDEQVIVHLYIILIPRIALSTWGKDKWI